MLFYEPLFLFLFAPAVYLLYLGVGARRAMRALVLLLASVVFYAWSEPVFVLVVFASVALDLFVARRIFALREGAPERSKWLTLGVCANIGVLVYYKYTGFLAVNFDALLDALNLGGVSIPKIALPIGVSFIVFEKITYLVDVYRGVTAPARSVSLYALYVFFFPKLLAGPIIKYHDIAGQMEACPPAHVDDFVLGFSRFMLGVVKKVLLADALAGGADLVFAHDAAELGFIEAWAGVIFFTFQIYFDFSGYSDMAIGLARLFNLRFPLNFHSPYQAQSVIDYWQRWHMTLTRWLMAYLYNPLALRISRRRAARGLPIDRAARSTLRGFTTIAALPTMVTIGLAGVWHGSAFTFVVFGLLHGAYLCINHAWRLWQPGPRSGAWHVVAARVALTYGCVLAGSVVFRATSLADAGAMLGGMLGLHGLRPAVVDPHAVADVLWLVALYAIVWGAPNTQQIMRGYAPALGRAAAGAWPRLVWQPTLPWAVAFGAAATLGLLSIGGTGEFLYYRF